MNSTLLISVISIAVGAAIALIINRLLNSKESLTESSLSQIQRELENLKILQNDQRKEIIQVNQEVRKELNERMERSQESLNRGLTASHQTVQTQFAQTSELIKHVTEKLTVLDNTNKQVLDFSSQLQNLQNILKNPKQRGVLGEYWLETLLGNVLATENFSMQYRLGKDEASDKELIADAVIFLNNLIIPIDAKFSLENYNRMIAETDNEKRSALESELKKDVKIRIDETSKYIQPGKGTTDFAFMFIPAEGVYYNLINAEVGNGVNSRSLIEYAFGKKVMIVSPTSFYAYLQTVLLGLRQLKIEAQTKEIIKGVGELQKHLASYSDFHRKLGNNLSTTVNQFNLSSSELRKLSKDAIRITNGDNTDLIETDAIEKPQNEG